MDWGNRCFFPKNPQFLWAVPSIRDGKSLKVGAWVGFKLFSSKTILGGAGDMGRNPPGNF